MNTNEIRNFDTDLVAKSGIKCRNSAVWWYKVG